MGLTGSDSLTDKSIPTFARGELPHYAGINTFLKAPYIEDVTRVRPLRCGGHRHPLRRRHHLPAGHPLRAAGGAQDLRASTTPYNYEMGIDLREQMTLCDVGDVFTIPANIEKTFDQISRAVSHVASSGALPIMIGGDHSIGLPVRPRHRAMHLQADRHRAFRPAYRHPGEGSRRAHAYDALVPRDRPSPTCRRSTWCRSASAAGRCRARA